MASNGNDVGSFSSASSAATWNVSVPSTGTYRLSVLAGANQNPGQHALFVDGAFSQLVKYSADLGWTYRGTTDVSLNLTAGTHALSLRASKDGTNVLPGANITLDRFDLYDVSNGELATYPAIDARLNGGATISTTGAASLSGSASASFYATAAETGYYDVTTKFQTTSSSTVTLKVNSRDVQLPAAAQAGTWTATARVFLPQGVNELTVTAPNGAAVSSITTLRGASQKQSDTDPGNVYRSEAESLPLAGTARVQTVASGSNGSADASGTVHDVAWIGNGAGNTLSIPARPGSEPASTS
jgi:hypothetical protein